MKSLGEFTLIGIFSATLRLTASRERKIVQLCLNHFQKDSDLFRRGTVGGYGIDLLQFTAKMRVSCRFEKGPNVSFLKSAFPRRSCAT